MSNPGVKALLETESPFKQEYFALGQEGIDYLNSVKVLCIGAGGLGCEILKSLALSGFRHIDVIDMDTIDVSNLNRQFLFRASDVGKSKAQVAADFIKRRVPTCEINAHHCRIEEMSDEFYKSFHVIIGGLDSEKARSWINQKLHNIYDEEELSIPYIDGGTEAWKGHVKVIIPGQTACMNCQAELYTKQQKFQFCTITNSPRQPEHCIAYVQDILWPKERKGEKLDGDNDDHISWVVERAIEHGNKFGLSGITFSMARGVIKNIIPAIASTQAIVASMCTTEALKFVTQCAQNINNSILMNGMVGVYCDNYCVSKNPDCIVCGRVLTEIPAIEGETVEEFRNRLGKDFDFPRASLSITLENGKSKFIYHPVLPATAGNMKKAIAEFLDEQTVIVATSIEREKHMEIVLVKK